MGKPHALVTGGAGFIGSHLTDRLLADGWRVTVVDNFDPYYSPEMKSANIAAHLASPDFRLVEADIRELSGMRAQLDGGYDVIVHLAAKAGVRPSLLNPRAFEEVNIGGTRNMLELAREWGARQFVFGSSSSVYGVNPRVPWSEDDGELQPISPYASTKICAEQFGLEYSREYGIRFIALRFFTVYGPRQRPDLAIHKFARLMLAGQPIPVYGDMQSGRDYTHVSDIVSGIRAAMEYGGSPFEIINLGTDRPITLAQLVEHLQQALGVPALLDELPGHPGDVPITWANIARASRLLGYRPRMPFGEGLRDFAAWLRAM